MLNSKKILQKFLSVYKKTTAAAAGTKKFINNFRSFFLIGNRGSSKYDFEDPSTTFYSSLYSLRLVCVCVHEREKEFRGMYGQEAR
jgi:hypothetical protein